MKKLLIASFLILFSSTAFSETYTCNYDGEDEVFKFERFEDNKFIYSSKSFGGIMEYKIAQEDKDLVYLFDGSYFDEQYGLLVTVINKTKGKFLDLSYFPENYPKPILEEGNCEITQSYTLSEMSYTTYDDLREYFIENFENVKEETKSYSLIGALAGGAFKNSDIYVEAYRFSTKEDAKKLDVAFGDKCFSRGYFLMCPNEDISNTNMLIIKKF